MASQNISKNRRHKWAMDFSTRVKLDRQTCALSELDSPVGYIERSHSDSSTQERDASLVAKKCWDVALAPLKQLPMNLFLMYMAGSSISIFPIMMVGMMLWRPVQALMALKTTFKMLEGSPQAYVQMFVFTLSNFLGIALALYKCSSMGLLPIYSSDWLSFLDPQQRVEFSGGGMSL